MQDRSLSLSDRLVMNVDRSLRAMFGGASVMVRPNPAAELTDAELTEKQQRHAAGLMRVNHAGEVAAQALYHGQSLTARRNDTRESLERAADEEGDHLAWCEQRLGELGGRTSLLNPFWYLGSFAVGALAGAAGDKWSLGFVAETERQVTAHLTGHLRSLPNDDARSRAIVNQMREDEAHHATTALEAGGARLPNPIPKAMALVARVMTKTAYWV